MFVATTLVLAGPSAVADHEDMLKVLVITEFDQRAGPFKTIANVFSSELLQREHRPVVMRYIDLYGDDEQGDEQGGPKTSLVAHEFASDPADLVLALGPPAVSFWQNNMADRFSDIPLLACATELGGIDPEYIATQWAAFSRYSYSDQVSHFKELLPNTNHVFMIMGATPHEQKLANVAQTQTRHQVNDVKVESSVHMSQEEMIERVGQLQPGSVVYHGAPHTDANGELLSEEESLAQIRAATNAPVFGPFDNQLGRGIVGGRLIQLEAVGRELANLAFDLINGKAVETGVRYIELSPPKYDWRELEAWNIPLQRLPEGSELLFQPPGPWALYKEWIIAIALLIAAQAWLIAQWSVQRRRSRRSAAENVTLSTRLITAHEDERKLIARELHDDFSQRLARLSIDASVVASGSRSEKNSEIMAGMKEDLMQIGKDVHELSYRLHPSLLGDLGLANALRAECDRMRRLTDISIIDRIEDVDFDLPMDKQLNLYRIGQEALRNAVRHSEASSVEISLRCDEKGLALGVRDDGRGLAAAGTGGSSSLGLMSMQERARLLGTRLMIDSSANHGTRVRICVPAAACHP